MSQFEAIPQELRVRPQWLVWRFEENPKGTDKKPLKVPYYTNGAKRFGKQGDTADRKQLVTLDRALALVERADSRYTGVGFAFLPGDGLIGVDIDKCIDLETGEVSELALNAIAGCDSYTEYSPSGTGVHIIVSGETDTFKSNKIGLEVFSGRQYFTFTGRQYANSPAAINPIAAEELARLRTLVRSNGPSATGLAKPGAPLPPGAVGDRARLEQALSYIPADSHDVWIRVGMGLFSALGNDGFGLWDYWSSKAANYGGPDECKRRWASFQDGVRITEATIFKLGIDCGWKPPRSILPAPIPASSPRPPRVSDTTMPTSQPSPPPPGGEAAAVSSAEQAPRGGGLGPAGAEAPRHESRSRCAAGRV